MSKNFKVKNGLEVTTNITASGDISASGTVFADSFQSATGGSGIDFNDSLDLAGNITASGNISSSGTITSKIFNAIQGGNSDAQGLRFDNRTDQGIFGHGFFTSIMAPESITIHIDSNDNGTAEYFNVVKDQKLVGQTTNELFRVQEDGNVGIATTSPVTKLQVEGNISSSGTMFAHTGSFTHVPTINGITTFAAAGNLDIGPYNFRARTLQSDVGTGTVPISISSTTKCTNLNADLLDDQEGSYYTSFLNATGNITASNISASGTIQSTGNITTDGTLTAEQITSTDDMTVTDDLTVGGQMSASGKVLGKDFEFTLPTANDRKFRGLTNAGVRLHDSSGGWAMEYGFQGNDARNLGGFGAFGGGSLEYFYVGNHYQRSVMTIHSGSNSGVVIGDGIVSTVPTKALQVKGDISASGDLFIDDIAKVQNITASGNISSSGTGINFLSGDLDFSGSRTIGTVGASSHLNINPEADLLLGSNNTDRVFIGRQSGTAGYVRIFANSSTVAAEFRTESIAFNHNITASGNISSSGTITAEHIVSLDDMVVTDDLEVQGNYSGSATSTFTIGGNATIGGNIDLEGDIDVNGTANLDNIDVDGTANFADNITIAENKAIFFDSTDTFIKANTGNPEDLVISADEDIILAPDDNIQIEHGATTYAEFLGDERELRITGKISASGDIITTGDVIAENYIVRTSVSNITQSFSSGSTVFGDSIDDTHQFTGSVSVSGSISIPDTAVNNGILIGDGDDLQIYHDGSNSVIRDGGAGDLLINGSIVRIRDVSDGNSIAVFTDGAGTELRHNNTTRFETTTTGIKVSGNISASSHITASGNISSSGELSANTVVVGSTITHIGDTNTLISFGTDTLTFKAGNESFITITEDGSQDNIVIGDGGDIDFHVKAGGNNTLFVQGSSQRVGIGVASPASKLHVDEGDIRIDTAAGGNQALRFSETSTTKAQVQYKSGDEELNFVTVDSSATASARMTIKSEQDATAVGIGTTSPTKPLQVTGDISASGALMGVTNITASGKLTVGGVANFNGSFVNIGGGFGSTGVSIASDGDIQTNGTLTIDGAISASSNITASGNYSGSSTSTFTIGGKLIAGSKSFVIDRPEGGKLEYGVLEGQQNDVFFRGELKGDNVIYLPQEWEWLVDDNTITVQLTSIGKHQELFVKEIKENKIFIDINGMFKTKQDIHCYHIIHGTRKDVELIRNYQ